MIEITLKENGTKYQLPISDEQLAEIKYLLDTSVIDACEYEVDYKSKYYDILPATADLEQLNNIARDIVVLEKQDKIYWLEAVMLAEELGEIKLKTTLEKPSKIEIAIDGIFSQKYFYDWIAKLDNKYVIQKDEFKLKLYFSDLLNKDERNSLLLKELEIHSKALMHFKSELLGK